MKHAAACALAGHFLLAGAPAARGAVAREGQPVMGTVLTVTVVAADRATATNLAKAAIDEARRWDDALTIWRDDGELARLNARAGQGPIAIGVRLEQGLLAMLEYAKQTGGAFEPAVASLPDRGDEHASLRSVRDALSIRLVAHHDGADASLAAGSRLDPGGIGKGLALDAIVALLKRGGATSAFLDFGGSSQTALGRPPGNDGGWPVAISGDADGEEHGVVLLADMSLSTSRSGATDTKPILDPRTKLPVPGGRIATVLAPSAAAADAWSTALIVLGPDGLDAARAAGIEAFLDSPSGSGTTSGFRLTPVSAFPRPHSGF